MTTSTATPTAAASALRFTSVRGRKYCLRTWGDERATPLLLLHGAMDSSACFQFAVEHLPAERFYVAPDWCGGGQSEHSYCHWFPDYLADLDALLEQLSPGKAVDLVGHSRGGNVACLYAGARPERVARLMTIEGLGFSFLSPDADQSVTDCAAWLAQQRDRREPRAYDSVEKVAESLQRNNPRLTAGRAQFLAQEWSLLGEDGKFRLATVFFPREKEGVPVALPQARAYWRRIAAQVCYVSGALSHFSKLCAEKPGEVAQSKACFAHWSEVEIPGAGHMVQYDQPELLAAEIARFFELGAAARQGNR
jgi:pimeloyl-ACP methyl ester carboxylesterase